MSHMKNLLSNNESLLIFGSLNAKKEDRYLDRSSIYPIQIIDNDSVKKAQFFQNWGELGISSSAYTAKNSNKDLTFYLSTGPDLIELELKNKPSIRYLEIPRLNDVHELTLIDNLLWLANTGYDEAVAYDIFEHKVVHRMQLKRFNINASLFNKGLPENATETQEIDHFHCNQIFQGIDSKLYALVHHVTGKQLITRVAKKILKKQGDGGVIELESGRRIQLWLKSPHTVRIINSHYWVFDSGNNSLNIYDQNWNLEAKLPTKGFGRGAALSNDDNFYYVGISEKRKRYLAEGEHSTGNIIQVFDTQNRGCIGEITIPDGLEQINNVYLVQQEEAQTLANLNDVDNFV